MGADQSAPLNGQLKSQRDEDIPYTSYSLAKPIDGDTPRSSPRLATKTRLHSGSSTHRDHSASRDSSSSSAASGPKHNIVVVAEGATRKDEDNELQKLAAIPPFMPILKGSLNLPGSQEPDIIERLDSRQVLKLCLRYQDHLKQCAEAVAFDQNSLCIRIKEIDYVIRSIYAQMTDRQKKFAKYAEQVSKVQEMHNVLIKVKSNTEQTVELMKKLNDMLPEEDQLEPFSMQQNKT